MLSVITLAINVLYFLIIADVILSWVMPNRDQFPRNVTTQITDPLYAPIRALLNPQKLGGLDLSPLLVLLLLSAMRRMLHGGGGF